MKVIPATPDYYAVYIDFDEESEGKAESVVGWQYIDDDTWAPIVAAWGFRGPHTHIDDWPSSFTIVGYCPTHSDREALEQRARDSLERRKQ